MEKSQTRENSVNWIDTAIDGTADPWVQGAYRMTILALTCVEPNLPIKRVQIVYYLKFLTTTCLIGIAIRSGKRGGGTITPPSPPIPPRVLWELPLAKAMTQQEDHGRMSYHTNILLSYNCQLWFTSFLKSLSTFWLQLCATKYSKGNLSLKSKWAGNFFLRFKI